MKSRDVTILFSCVAICVVSAVPVGHGVEKKDAIGDRESTKEILNLEQQLKEQAGENKKFFPSQGSHAVPQVDGLSDAVSSGDDGRPGPEQAAENALPGADDIQRQGQPDVDDKEPALPAGGDIEPALPAGEGLDPRKMAMLEEVRDLLDEDIMKLLKERPELWEDVLSLGKIY